MRRITEKKDEVREKNGRDSDLEHGIVYRRKWMLRKVDIQQLELFEMWIWRRLMKISWTEHRSNEDKNRSLMNTIRHRQKNWFGHVLRSESLPHTVLEGRMEGTRTRGSATMTDWMKSNNVEYEHIKERAHDRKDWHHWRPGAAWKGRAHKRE